MRMFLISNDNPPRHYMAYQVGREMRLKKYQITRQPNGEVVKDVVVLGSKAKIDDAKEKIKKWIENEKGREALPAEAALIEEFDEMR